jgi:hypothetical protein
VKCCVSELPWNCGFLARSSRREEPPTLVFNWILRQFPPAWPIHERHHGPSNDFGHTHAFRFCGHYLADWLTSIHLAQRRLEHRGSLQEREPTAWEGSTRAGGNDWRNKSQPASTRARFEVRNVSLFGSTELANAGVGCNIAQIIASEGNE